MSGTIDHVNLSLKIDSLLLNALDLDTATDPLLVNLLLTLSNGTASGQASQQWHDTRTLGASATENLDLAGALTNAFGVTVTFTKVKLLYVRASAANNAANLVQVQRASSNGVPVFLAASGGLQLNQGGVFLFYDPVGVTVTAGTGDLLTITNSAGTNSVTYDVVVIGAD
jgi:hypothetical protein